MDGVNLPADLDVLLRQTMAEEPSVEFLPRVRERIAGEQVRARSSWRLVFAGVGMVTAVVMAIVASGTGDVVAPSPPPAPGLVYVMRGMQVPQQVSPPTAISLETGRRGPRAVRASGVDVPLGDVPPVIVDRRQRSAVERMVALAVQGRLPEDALLQASPSLQLIEERLGGLAVRPVEVSPIAVGGVLQSGAEAKQPPRPADAGFRP
jgi:hypothetical protein